MYIKIVDILDGDEMKKFKEMRNWKEKKWPDGNFMCDDGTGHKLYVKNDFPKSKKWICWQHIGSKRDSFVCF